LFIPKLAIKSLVSDISCVVELYAFINHYADVLMLPVKERPSSWCNDVFTAFTDLDIASWWTQGLPPSIKVLPYAFKKEIKRRVRLRDESEWHASLAQPRPANLPAASFSARAHYHGIKPVYGREKYLNQDDRRSSLFKFYLRSGNFGLNARTQHGPPDAITLARKSCKLCPGQLIEDEEHFLLQCSAFANSRVIMWLNIESNLCRFALFNEWRLINLSPPKEQAQYLLGRSEHFGTHKHHQSLTVL
jgi:hypothetical protein